MEGTVTPVRYAPPEGHALDVELVQAAELRDRVARVENRGIERTDFHSLFLVTRGHYRHMVDFEEIRCSPASCLFVRPGQTHRFGPPSDWDGWLLILRSELMQPGTGVTRIGELELFGQIDALPTHIRMTGETRRAVIEGFERMARDSQAGDDPRLLDPLLRAQFEVLLRRLYLARTTSIAAVRDEPAVLERFRTFRMTVEAEFRRWHKVCDYADHLGCSPRSINRATRTVADMSAKAFLVARIVLEAKRHLAHTVRPVGAISEQLGFDEPTNFVKFFRRETGMTPRAFRVQQSAGSH